MVPTTNYYVHTPHPIKIKNAQFSKKICTTDIFGATSPKMMVPTINDKGLGPRQEPVAKDKEVRLPTTVYAKNRYQDHILSDKPENHPLDEQRHKLDFIPHWT